MIAAGESEMKNTNESIKPAEIASFAVWLFGILLIAALPVGVGIFATMKFGAVGEVDPGVEPWLVHASVGIVIGWLVLSEIAEFIIKILISNTHELIQNTFSTVAGFIILYGFYTIVFESPIGSFVATVLSHLCVLALLPVVKKLEKKQIGHGSKH